MLQKRHKQLWQDECVTKRGTVSNEGQYEGFNDREGGERMDGGGTTDPEHLQTARPGTVTQSIVKEKAERKRYRLY